MLICIFLIYEFTITHNLFTGKNDYATQKITIEFIRVKSYEDDQSANLKVIGIENLENLRGKVIDKFSFFKNACSSYE